MMERLLAEFPPVATSAWEEAIAKDLKGTSDAEKLIWRSPEGIDREALLSGRRHWPDWISPSRAWRISLSRGTRAAGGWRIREHIRCSRSGRSQCRGTLRCRRRRRGDCVPECGHHQSSDLGILVANLGEIPLHFAHVTPAMVRLIADRMQRRQSGTLRVRLTWTGAPIRRSPPMCLAEARRVRALYYPRAGLREQRRQRGGGGCIRTGVRRGFPGEMQERGVAVDRVCRSAWPSRSPWVRSSSCRLPSCAHSGWCGRRLWRVSAASASRRGRAFVRLRRAGTAPSTIRTTTCCALPLKRCQRCSAAPIPCTLRRSTNATTWAMQAAADWRVTPRSSSSRKHIWSRRRRRRGFLLPGIADAMKLHKKHGSNFRTLKLPGVFARQRRRSSKLWSSAEGSSQVGRSPANKF